MVISTAEKRKANGKALKKRETTESRHKFSAKVLPPEEFIKLLCPRIANDVPMEITDRIAVASEAEKTSKNLPSTRSMREMGLERMVSIVPRSFSPAVRSMAGYIAPVIHKMITVYPMKLPKVAPLTFSGGATFSCLIANGDSTDAGRFFAARRSFTTESR